MKYCILETKTAIRIKKFVKKQNSKFELPIPNVIIWFIAGTLLFFCCLILWKTFVFIPKDCLIMHNLELQSSVPPATPTIKVRYILKFEDPYYFAEAKFFKRFIFGSVYDLADISGQFFIEYEKFYKREYWGQLLRDQREGITTNFEKSTVVSRRFQNIINFYWFLEKRHFTARSCQTEDDFFKELAGMYAKKSEDIKIRSLVVYFIYDFKYNRVHSCDLYVIENWIYVVFRTPEEEAYYLENSIEHKASTNYFFNALNKLKAQGLKKPEKMGDLELNFFKVRLTDEELDLRIKAFQKIVDLEIKNHINEVNNENTEQETA